MGFDEPKDCSITGYFILTTRLIYLFNPEIRSGALKKQIGIYTGVLFCCSEPKDIQNQPKAKKHITHGEYTYN